MRGLGGTTQGDGGYELDVDVSWLGLSQILMIGPASDMAHDGPFPAHACMPFLSKSLHYFIVRISIYQRPTCPILEPSTPSWHSHIMLAVAGDVAV